MLSYVCLYAATVFVLYGEMGIFNPKMFCGRAMLVPGGELTTLPGSLSWINGTEKEGGHRNGMERKVRGEWREGSIKVEPPLRNHVYAITRKPSCR